MILPGYINAVLCAYLQMSCEDRATLMDERLFDDDALSCPTEYLRLFADEIGVNIDGIDEATARMLIADTKESLLRSGTVYALKKSLNALCNVVVEEKSSFTFALNLSTESREITPFLVKRIEQIANRNKNVRSLMEEIRLGYLKKHMQTIAIGGVGETMSEAVMIDGYSCTISAVQYLMIGAVGETSSYAVMEVKNG